MAPTSPGVLGVQKGLQYELRQRYFGSLRGGFSESIFMINFLAANFPLININFVSASKTKTKVELNMRNWFKLEQRQSIYFLMLVPQTFYV